VCSQTFITGLGCISGAGRNLPETMRQIYSGKRNPKPPRRIGYNLEKQYPIFEIYGFEQQVNDLSFHFAKVAIIEALAQAGLDQNSLRRYRVGVFLGSTAGCFFNKEDYYRKCRAEKSGDPSYISEVLLQGSIAHQILKEFNLSGPAMTLSNACASGTDAIGLASKMIEKGECDIALAGGCDEIVRMVYLGFISLMNTSEEPCKPFSKSRKGLNLGEGAGVCVLESRVSVEKRGVQPLGSIEGYSTVADSYHITAPEPSGRGLRKAFLNAMGEARIKPEDIAFINTHGTGTVENDKVEGKTIAGIFGKEVPITVTKAYTGHALGAAGGLEAVFSMQFLMDQKIPGVPDYQDFDEECGIVPHQGIKEVSGQYACSSSLAFGGVNSVIVIRRPS
jgi:3-oxoacyl-(acyl-carrier-protein) synthase